MNKVAGASQMTFHPKPNSTTVFYRKSQGVCVHLFLETIWRVFGLHNIKACAKAGPLVELADAHRPPGGQFSLRNGKESPSRIVGQTSQRCCRESPALLLSGGSSLCDHTLCCWKKKLQVWSWRGGAESQFLPPVAGFHTGLWSRAG